MSHHDPIDDNPLLKAALDACKHPSRPQPDSNTVLPWVFTASCKFIDDGMSAYGTAAALYHDHIGPAHMMNIETFDIDAGRSFRSSFLPLSFSSLSYNSTLTRERKY